MIIAAREGNTEIMQLLLNRGAEIEARDKYGNTALMIAITEGNTEIIQLLQEKVAEKTNKENSNVDDESSSRKRIFDDTNEGDNEVEVPAKLQRHSEELELPNDIAASSYRGASAADAIHFSDLIPSRVHVINHDTERLEDMWLAMTLDDMSGFFQFHFFD